MKLRHLLISVLSIALLLTNSPTASADAFNPLASEVSSGNIHSYVVEDGSVERNGYVAIMPPAVSSADQTRSGKWKWCTGLDDPICDPKNNPISMKATSIFGPCENETQENCVDSLEIGVGTSLEKATLIRSTAGLTFPASPQYGFPGSSTISLWKTPSGAHPFALMPRMQLYFRDGTFFGGDIFTDVIPYEEVKGDYRAIRFDTSTAATPETRYKMSPHAQNCVFEEDGVCGVAQDFVEGTRVKLKIRVSKKVGGWFQGRMKDPVLDVSDFSQNNNLITIEATSVSVPRMVLEVNPASFSDQEKIWYENFGHWPALDGNLGSGPQAGSPEVVFPYIDFYRDRVKDTVAGTSTFWNFKTTSWGQGSKCLQDTSKVLGIVTTNALAYDGGSPSFEDGSLNYRVSGLHFMPDGMTTVRGTYNLVMRSEVARCLYGFSNAPIRASISVLGGENTSIATTITGERNGWLSLAAAGFTFSNKTIQVKLSQETPIKTSTIKCVKGKISKSITAQKPKCPIGYRKSA